MTKIIVLEHERLEVRYTWKNHWVAKYESAWSVLEKFKYANELLNNVHLNILFGKDEILHKYSQKGRPRRLKNLVAFRDLITLDGFSDDKFFSILGVRLKTDSQNIIKYFSSLSHANKGFKDLFRPNLTYCPECIKFGYHSIFHQIHLIQCCPFHELSLLFHCPLCNGVIPYELPSRRYISASTCNCLHPFYANLPKYNFYKEWGNNLVEIKDSNLQKFLSLDEQQVNDLNKNIVFYDKNVTNNWPKLISYINSLFLDNNENTIHKGHYIIRSIPHVLKLQDKTISTYQKPDWFYRGDIPNIEIEKAHQQIMKGICLKVTWQSSLKTFRSIARHIRHRILRKHKSCIKKLFQLDKYQGKVCPYAFSYIMWRKNIEGVDHYSKYRQLNVPNTYFFNKVAVASSEDFEHIHSLFLSLDKMFQLYPNRLGTTQWILNHVFGLLLMHHFKQWLLFSEDSIKRGDFENVSYLNDYPLYIINHPENMSKPIEFHVFNENYQAGAILHCPFNHENCNNKNT
ncbi:hypothetical protein [Ammoniphilus resinae]|uniref:Uncharacterized protein n=1 Tax=Ammoniphilus resinae TaxID=861532 RepID=A0ABS4GNZ2_9BACL|nr:hypothetical protein [Ammoniphilus resinae]MBP1931984.1 hypothetical protein [Ammoniphilus resinae]